MNITVSSNSKELGKLAGQKAAELIREAINAKGEAAIILATGSSQFETINQLISEKGINWGAVTMFHLDEYISLPKEHPANFGKYLKERFLNHIPPLKKVFLIDGNSDANKEVTYLNDVIRNFDIDVALVGVGENGHLAFNDPPANYDITDPFIIVELDDISRQQQVNEGWFEGIEVVPKQSITMTIHQICNSSHIICSVPEKRKSDAVANCFGNGISNLYPASILQNHKSCFLFLERVSAEKLLANHPSKIDIDV